MNTNRPDQTWTYHEIAAKAERVRSFLSDLGINVNPASALGLVLKEAEQLAAEWESGQTTGSIKRLMNAAHANRISDAILATTSDPGAVDCLKRMAKSSLNLSSREVSQGKDALWEVDLAALLKSRGIPVSHREPDLVADFDCDPCPIACKKVYSERNFGVQMRKGAQQIAKTGSTGLVAINLDDLVPEDSLLQSESQSSASDFLARFNLDFINRHNAEMQRFIVDKRCLGVLVSTTTLADIVQSSTRFNTHTQTTLWTLSSIGSDQADRISKIRSALGVLTEDSPR